MEIIPGLVRVYFCPQWLGEDRDPNGGHNDGRVYAMADATVPFVRMVSADGTWRLIALHRIAVIEPLEQVLAREKAEAEDFARIAKDF